jgi:glycine/D-amino acid oxidase-like deaminating enzyme
LLTVPCPRQPNPSLWLSTSDPGDFAPLAGDARADVVVVGAGVTGLTTARILVEAGASVIVVDAGAVCAGATGNTTAKITSLHGLTYTEVASRFDEDLAPGAVGGALATAAMSVVMLASRRLGLVGTLAPEHVTEAALDAAGVERDEGEEDAATSLAHFAYGTASGAVFGLVGPHLPGPRAARGLLFAGGLLLVSYEGWVPAARILPPLRVQTPAGASTLVTSHLVYGVVLSLTTLR